MKQVINILLVALLTGCKWSNAELGDSYYFLDSDEAYDIGYPRGAIIYKSQQKNLYSQVIVAREVVEVKHNDQFIVAKQLQPKNKVDSGFFIKREDYSKLLVSDTTYFIIEKHNDKIFGPMMLDSCNKLKRMLGIQF